MTTLTVDRKKRWDITPRRWLRLYLNLALGDFQIAHLIELNSLHSWIGNGQRTARHDVPRAELVFDVSAFAHTYQKLSDFLSDPATHPKA